MSKQEMIYKELSKKDYKSLTGSERVLYETLKKMLPAKEKIINKIKENKEVKKENKNSSTISEEEFQKNLRACKKQAKIISSNRIIEDIRSKKDKALK